MYKPAHPGEVLRELYLERLGLTVTNDAESLGITRKTLSELINGRIREASIFQRITQAKPITFLEKTD